MPIYKDEIRREYKDSEMFDSFLSDCDRAGTTYQDFCKDAALAAKLYGVAYVVVDNSNVMADSLGDALSNRQLPFLKLVTPDMIKDWTIDVFGRLSSFSYTETIQTGRNSAEEITYAWTPKEWAISVNGKTTGGAHNLGKVPVVQWRARNTKLTTIKPPSEFLSVAQANYFLFQLCSWHTQILRDQAFNILTMPDTGSSDITVGTNNVLTYPPESNHTPAFISPAAAPAEMLTSQMDRTIQEMFRMSGLNSVIGLQTDQSKSGVAKQWDFETTNRRLAGFSARCEKADAAIVALYELWSGDSIDYHCEYPKDFRINDVADSLAEAQTALELGFDTPTYELSLKTADTEWTLTVGSKNSITNNWYARLSADGPVYTLDSSALSGICKTAKQLYAAQSITDIDVDDVTKMVVQTANGGTLSFAQNDSTWTLTDDAEYNLNQDIVKKMASTICDLKTKWSVTEPQADAVYGLDTPNAIVTLIASDGTSIQCSFGGNDAEDDTLCYLRSSGAAGVVYEVSTDALNAFAYDKAALEAEEKATPETADVAAEDPVGNDNTVDDE